MTWIPKPIPGYVVEPSTVYHDCWRVACLACNGYVVAIGTDDPVKCAEAHTRDRHEAKRTHCPTCFHSTGAIQLYDYRANRSGIELRIRFEGVNAYHSIELTKERDKAKLVALQTAIAEYLSGSYDR